jgi:hypothetical protein
LSDLYHWDGEKFFPLPEDDLTDDLPDRMYSLVIPAETETLRGAGDRDDDERAPWEREGGTLSREREGDGDTTFVIHREMDDGPLCERQFVYLFDTREQAEAMAGEAREFLGRVVVRKVNVRSLDERFWVRLRLALPDDPDAFLELWLSTETLRRHCRFTNPLRDDDD